MLRHIEDECYDPSGEDTFVNRLWLSDDGQSWQQSEALDLWAPIAVAGGWEAFAVTPAGLVRWTSADGHSWREAGPVMGAPEGEIPRAWSSSTGVRMLAVLDPEPFEIILLASNDGEAWTEVAPDGDALDGGFLHTVAVALIDGQDRWLVVYDFEGEPSRLLSSVDLASWQAHELLDLEVREISGSSAGFLVTAQRPCPADFGCDPEEQRQFFSREGMSWSEITPSIFSVSAFADGPAGVIALGSNDPDWSFTDPVEVWRLGR